MVQMSDLRGIRAVIFDMDGLLLDSERVALSTFVDSCRESGYDPDVEVYYKCIGGNEERTKRILTEGYGQEFPFDEINRRWQAMYEDLASTRPFPIKPGALELLELLRANGIRMAVVTSTRRESAIRKISNAGLLAFFEFVVGGDDIQHSKPHPEIYQTACLRLGEEPCDCLGLEDSDNGVLSASAAGLKVIQVPDMLEPSVDVKALGHAILPNLLEVQKLLRNGATNGN